MGAPLIAQLFRAVVASVFTYVVFARGDTGAGMLAGDMRFSTALDSFLVTLRPLIVGSAPTGGALTRTW